MSAHAKARSRLAVGVFARGVAEGHRQAVEHLHETAAAHVGRVGDARRGGALNTAADAIRDGRTPGCPVVTDQFDEIGAPRPHGDECDMAEKGRRLASRREDLITQGVDPGVLEVPVFPSGEQVFRG